MSIPLTGQSGALSGTAVQLDSGNTGASCNAFSIKAPLSNAKPCWIGNASVTSSTGYQLDPGDEVTYERLASAGQPQYQLTPSSFYAVGTSPDIVTWLASP